MCFCVFLYFTACMLYYCNTVGWAWWDWGLIWWLTILLQWFDTVGWATWPVKISSPNDLYCVEWHVKSYSTKRLAYLEVVVNCIWDHVIVSFHFSHVLWFCLYIIIIAVLCKMIWIMDTLSAREFAYILDTSPLHFLHTVTVTVDIWLPYL